MAALAGEVLLKTFDVVGALKADGSGESYSVNVPNPLIGTPDASHPFGGVGTRFLAGAKIYPGGTFPTTGPFVDPNDRSLLHTNKIIGNWFCNGLITNDVPQLGPNQGNVAFGNSNIDFQIIGENGIDLSLFIQDTLMSLDSSKIGTGSPVREQNGAVVVGFNKNSQLKSKVKIKTYVITDSAGLQFMNRYEFEKPVVINFK